MLELTDYVVLTALQDKLKQPDMSSADHARLLGAGLVGEVGSLLTELKKKARDREAYPLFHERMVEEAGDFLWYLLRLTTVLAPDCLEGKTWDELLLVSSDVASRPYLDLGLAAATAAASAGIEGRDHVSELLTVWRCFASVMVAEELDLRAIIEDNIEKSTAIFGARGNYHELFDKDCNEEDQLPRRLKLEFRELRYGTKLVTLLRSGPFNIGDRLTDNVEDPDWYRFHDVLHLAFAVHLGWSPVARKLLNCKRKSYPDKDENQDGARAMLVEESVSAVVFQRAKRLRLFENLNYVSYGLLKLIREFVAGFEVAKVPLWQWERAILEGFRIFRELRKHSGGTVTLHIEAQDRRLIFTPPESSPLSAVPELASSMSESEAQLIS